MPRSSVGSAPDDAMLGRYPVDDITENTNCELHVKITNISMKVADAVAFTNPPEATFHCNPIPAGYARVLVDEVVDQYSGLELDIPGGDEEHTLGDAKHRIILWRKDYIIFRRPPTPHHPTPRRSPPPSQQTPAPPSPPTREATPPPPSPAKCQATPPPSPTQRQTSTPPPSPAQPQATASPAQLQATPPRPTQPRQPSPPPQQSQKRHPAAMVRSGTSRGSTGSTGGGKRYKYGPSLTPLLQRAYDRFEEEIAAISKSKVEAHFAPKPPTPPREKVPEETIDHFIRMAQPPAPKPVDTDYERHIRKLNRACLRKEASSGSSKQEAAVKKCGKTIPQLGEQAAQSIPSLVVPTTRDSTRAQYYCGQTVYVPEVGNVVITEEHIMQAEVLKITVGQLLEIEPMPVLREDEIKRKYVRGQPLVEPDKVKNLPTRMYELHQWYMNITKISDRLSLMVNVKEEHYYHEKAVSVEYSELFQLYNQDALDKSIVSCYCL